MYRHARVPHRRLRVQLQRHLGAATGTPTAGLSEPGGTSGIVIDNQSTTQTGAQQVYFSTLTGHTAVQASQAGLNWGAPWRTRLMVGGRWDFVGGGRQDRTADLRVMNPSL